MVYLREMRGIWSQQGPLLKTRFWPKSKEWGMNVSSYVLSKNAFQSMWVNSVGNSQARVPGHSAPFHLGELRRIIVLSLKILPVSGKRTLCEGKCNARILVATVRMITSIHSPPHSVMGLPFLCESPSHSHSQLGASRAEPLTQDGDPHTLPTWPPILLQGRHTAQVWATGTSKTQFPPGF